MLLQFLHVKVSFAIVIKNTHTHSTESESAEGENKVQIQMTSAYPKERCLCPHILTKCYNQNASEPTNERTNDKIDGAKQRKQNEMGENSMMSKIKPNTQQQRRRRQQGKKN